MTHKTRDLTVQRTPKLPSTAPVKGGMPGSSKGYNALIADQDRVLGHGNRVVASVGLHGASEFMVADISASSATQVYPTVNFKQVVSRSRVTLTPGHMPVVLVTALPSGARQRFNAGIGAWESDGAGGAVEVGFTWSNGVDTATKTVSLQIPASEHQHFAQPSAAGAAWNEVFVDDIGPVTPDGFLESVAERARWSENVTLDIVIRYVESPRVIDCVVQEIPVAYAREQDDAGFTTPCHTSSNGVPLAVYPSPYPAQRLSEAVGGDGTGGTLQALDVADRQASRLGPCLVAWSAWNEATAVPTATEAAPKSFTTTAFTDFFDGSTTGYDAARRGWSGASGGTARRHDTAGEHQVMRGVAGVVEVVLRVYGRVVGAATGRVLLRASAESQIEARLTSTTYGWIEQRGALRCGVAADDPSVWQISGALLSAGVGLQLDVLYVVVEFAAIQ